MVILTTDISDQTFKVISRSNTSGGVYHTLLDKQTDTSTDGMCTTTDEGVYMEVEVTFGLKEGRYYMLDLFSDASRTDLIHRVKIFCTDQTVSDYDMLNGDYTQRTTDNDYIVP